MKRRSLLIVVALLCMASLMAAMAYTSATVTSAADLKITSTNSALLTLEPNANWNWGSNMAGTKDGTAQIINGELYFNIGKGVLGGMKGLQPNSVYEWNSLFTLRNMSAETLKVTVSADDTIAPYITFGLGSQDNGVKWLTAGESFTVDQILAGGDMRGIRCIAVKVTIPSGVTIPTNALQGNIIVDSVAIN